MSMLRSNISALSFASRAASLMFRSGVCLRWLYGPPANVSLAVINDSLDARTPEKIEFYFFPLIFGDPISYADK